MQNSIKLSACFFAMLVLFTSCAKNFYIDYSLYETSKTGETGILYLEPTKNSEKTTVTIDDNLLLSRKHVNSITINNIPVGQHSIHYSGGPWGYKEKMDEKLNIQIVADKKITKIIPVPPYSAGYWVYLGAISIASAITSYYATFTPQPTYSYTTY